MTCHNIIENEQMRGNIDKYNNFNYLMSKNYDLLINMNSEKTYKNIYSVKNIHLKFCVHLTNNISGSSQ